jgi:hypothetical protein
MTAPQLSTAPLAARRGVRQPVVIGELIRYALDQLEREDTGPP